MYLIYLFKFKNGKKYVGLTKDLLQRIRSHKCNARNNPILPVHRAIRKNKFNFIIEILNKNLTKNRAVKLEKRLIVKLNTLVPFGYNLTKGGEGTFGYKKTKQQIENHASKLRGIKKKFPVLKSTRMKLSKLMTGKNNHRFGRKQSLQTLIKKSKGKVLCIETGSVYISTADASRKLNINTSALNQCLLGHRQTSAGFRWRRLSSI